MSNPVIFTLFSWTLGAVFLSILFYRLAFSERKIFKGRMPILQFLYGMVLPPFVLIGVFQLYRVIERNQLVANVPLSDDFFLLLLFLLITLASVGNGMHVAGVSIDYKAQHLGGLNGEEQALIKAIEFFHHGFSHLIIHLAIALATLVYFFFEINHPVRAPLTSGQLVIVVLSAAIFGVLFALGVVEGGSSEVVLPLVLSLAVTMVIFIYRLDFPLVYLPTSIYFIVSHLSTFFFLAAWGIYHRGFPEIVGELRVKDGHPKSPGAKLPKSNF